MPLPMKFGLSPFEGLLCGPAVVGDDCDANRFLKPKPVYWSTWRHRGSAIETASDL